MFRLAAQEPTIPEEITMLSADLRKFLPDRKKAANNALDVAAKKLVRRMNEDLKKAKISSEKRGKKWEGSVSLPGFLREQDGLTFFSLNTVEIGNVITNNRFSSQSTKTMKEEETTIIVYSSKEELQRISYSHTKSQIKKIAKKEEEETIHPSKNLLKRIFYEFIRAFSKKKEESKVVEEERGKEKEEAVIILQGELFFKEGSLTKVEITENLNGSPHTKPPRCITVIRGPTPMAIQS